MATDELQYLMDFNAAICQAVAKSMKHLSDFVFVNMANLTLVRRDSYLSHLKSGIKPDMLAALRTAPLQLATLFLDSVIKWAEKIFPVMTGGSSSRKTHYHPHERSERKSDNKKSDRPAWKHISTHGQGKRSKGRSQYSSRPAKGHQSYKCTKDRTAGQEPRNCKLCSVTRDSQCKDDKP